MDILILGFAKMKIMPYANFYLEQIDYSKNNVDVVYWNRDLKDESLAEYPPSINFIEFKNKMDDGISKIKKIKHFHKYRSFVLQILERRKYDLIISLHTLPGLLILDKLLSKYRKRYILDYRDSTFENKLIFGGLIKLLAVNSKLVFVSSDAFRKYLPKKGIDIITSHNILVDSIAHRNDRKDGYIHSDKIRIAFWGLIRHPEHNIQIIKRLSNDQRFELHYYGREGQTASSIRKYLSENKINNVFLHGEYVPTDRYEFIKSTDIILNSYNDANTMLAMGNKYYDGIIFKIPQLCMPGSYMAERCEQKGVGFSFDPNDEDFANKIFNAYNHIDFNEFESNCDMDFDEIIEEYYQGVDRVKSELNR